MIDCCRRVLPALGVLLACAGLSACSMRRSGDQVTIETNKQYLEEQLCAGMYEIEQPLFNGSGEESTTYYQLATGKKFNDAIEFIRAEGDRHIAYIRDRSDGRREYLRQKHEADLKKLNSKNNAERDEAQKRALDYLFAPISGSENDERWQALERELAEFDHARGFEPFVESSKEPISWNRQAPELVSDLGEVSRFHAVQSSPDTCWAASLETAFRYLGYPYTEKQLVDTLRFSCRRKRSRTASLNQMLFAASNLYANGKGGVWLGKFPSKQYMTVDLGELSRDLLGVHFDFNSTYGTPHPQQPAVSSQDRANFNVGSHQFGSLPTGEYTGAAIELTERSADGKIKNGKIKIVRSTWELILAIVNKNPVIVGRQVSEGGHTVVVTGVTYRPGGSYDAVADIHRMDHRAHLAKVSYLDPSLSRAPDPMSGDDFLRDVVFAFYIERPK